MNLNPQVEIILRLLLAAGAGMYLISAIATATTVGILMLPKIRG